jgi:hypothetical protein
MPQHIFFSWQNDRETKTGRNLIERALEKAIATLKAEVEIDPAQRELAIDRDTKGVPGSPPLVETIFAKVDRATAFLSDLTYVGTRADGRRMPNPNVLLEHGWALKARTWRRIISVMNVAYGHPDEHELPFDLRQYRRPILYNCPDDATDDARCAARDRLANEFVVALRAILTDETLAAESIPAVVPDVREASARETAARLATDRGLGRLPGIVSRPSMTLRLAPLAAFEGRPLGPQQVEQAQRQFPPNVDVLVQTDCDGEQWWSIGVPQDVGKPNRESRWRTRLVRPGVIEFEATVGSQIEDDPEIVVEGRWLESEIVSGIERLGHILAELGLGGPAFVRIEFLGMENVLLTRSRPGGRVMRRPEFALPDLMINDPTDQPANALQEQFDILWQIGGWAGGSPSFGPGAWDGYAKNARTG